MTATILTGIAELVTNDPQRDGLLGIVEDAAVVVQEGTVLWVGSAHDAGPADAQIDLGGRAVLPGFVDSHSHLVFAGDRSAEFAARVTGTPYDGGGIAVSMAATRSASDDELRALVARRVAEMRAQGTTTVEIKSGYGLTVEDELRALRIAAEFTSETTFLGAHVVPPEYRDDRSAYIDLVCGPMLDACAPHARWIDVFCEPNSPHAFTEEESRRILAAGAAVRTGPAVGAKTALGAGAAVRTDAGDGLGLRVHGNQLGPGPGVQLAVEFGAASVDHCTYLSDVDIEALAGSATVATLLPGVEFSTRSPYPSGRRLIDAGVTVALACDCNPGTCYSSSVPMMIALAVREMGMTPGEAVWAATAGGAQALRRTDIGQITVGARADLTVLDAPTHLHLPYRAGVPIARALDLAEPASDR